MPRRESNFTSARLRPASSATSRPTSITAGNTLPCCPVLAGGLASALRPGRPARGVVLGGGGWACIGLAAGLTDPSAGLGAVGGYAALSNYTALGGALTVFALPQ